MFRNLLTRLFSQDAPDQSLAPDDAELAVAALLVRVARADERYGAAERARIDHLLAHRRHLDASAAADRRAAAEMIEAEAPDTVRFTRAIKDRIPLERRVEVIGALWDVALADGHRSPEEDAAVRLAANLLGVSDVESATARQRVERERDGQPDHLGPAAVGGQA
ncbi:TerB family tellurite resistance protein [Paracoccus luteus]|uniref:tellurite resistance TerB family protein n=1 Tax=Paracoccus luteus TaxID=2508543 RepID=UPI00106F142D|nr:TerB family tellurite resistance protein [Paracoccus luteus]